ncbi:hypothetical protein FRACYDRAFT_241789 [Fragilariopsis cylindrus CCMP1102]|uniref:Uncharacterized protein n=1 Tax=Fragilariopsis cylindrus CCMP1102 TaxID=635003 RepID=A0A1E7F5Q9_9STRA|nr:hypothetical protein FRACYDRAFT_241789 [Fragilariopsis cylindrus CCMP1102]|eukprot:OEU13454.1 hypothetical protein FRACYDRAFT_241789 [Fragilariopsis cylindrus CCMP1102]
MSGAQGGATKELGVRQQADEIVIEAVEEEGEEILEDDAVLRLGVMEQELLQEQEDKTKSEVLGDSNIDKLMNDMVGGKPTGIFDPMATQWEHKLDKVIKDAITISRQADIVMQMKMSSRVQHFHFAYDCNKEVDYVTDGMTDFLDAAGATQKVSTQEAEAIKKVKTETDQNSE